MSQVRIIVDDNKVERLRKAYNMAEIELETANKALADARRAVSVAKRKHTKAQQAYFNCKLP